MEVLLGNGKQRKGALVHILPTLSLFSDWMVRRAGRSSKLDPAAANGSLFSLTDQSNEFQTFLSTAAECVPELAGIRVMFEVNVAASRAQVRLRSGLRASLESVATSVGKLVEQALQSQSVPPRRERDDIREELVGFLPLQGSSDQVCFIILPLTTESKLSTDFIGSDPRVAIQQRHPHFGPEQQKPDPAAPGTHHRTC